MAPRIPLRHLSARVPWHDAGWNGTVCRDPAGNASCLVLNRIGSSRNDAAEAEVAGRSFDDLPPGAVPPCLAERVSFLAPRAQTRIAAHAYTKNSEDHRHIKPTAFVHPAYSVAATPFRWLLKEHAWGKNWRKGELAETALSTRWAIDAQPEREPERPEWLKDRPWIQGHTNQEALLESFFGALRPGKSLVFLYARRTPLVDDDRVTLVGVARVTHVGDLQEYDYTVRNPEIRSYLWERAVSHSWRPEGGDGVMLPLHDLLELNDARPDLDVSDCVPSVPDDLRPEFAYGSEHVSSSSAIQALLRIQAALRNVADRLDRDIAAEVRWIDQRLGELWELRGPYPGLGSVLCAAGVTQGHQLAHWCWEQAGENGDPWLALASGVQKPDAVPSDLRPQVKGFAPIWKHYSSPKGAERLAWAKMLARTNVTAEQATRWWDASSRRAVELVLAGEPPTDADVLANPYMLFERDRGQPGPISFECVDQAMFPAPSIRSKHAVPEPSAPEGPIDARRLRAALIAGIERAANDGHTLVARQKLLEELRALPVSPSLHATDDLLEVHADFLLEHLRPTELAGGSPAYQLDRLADVGELVRSTVNKRVQGKRHVLDVDWGKALRKRFGEVGDALEQQARAEKEAALSELASSRISVLIGRAGTGKTTLLQLLCDAEPIAARGVLLLAPTGKARVRLQQATERQAQTLAQFLRPIRYREETGQYVIVGDLERHSTHKTLIVDEASMLTEEQLAALLDAVAGIDRLILVGDPGQLPPIGAGRPFVDIVDRLRPDRFEPGKPRVGSGYVELLVTRRTVGDVRNDLELAEWFSGRPVGGGDDDILAKLASGEFDETLRIERWTTTADLARLLPDVVREELKIGDGVDCSFDVRALGGRAQGEYVYFGIYSAQAAETWQVLSPVRGQAMGTAALNRLVQREFRAEVRERAATTDPRWQKVPRPMGPDGIVYGDKVINLSNHPRSKVWPERVEDREPLRYVANGEIGIVSGPFRRRGQKVSLRQLGVTFSSQKEFEYKFWPSELDEEGSYLELAYALTVHKAQGSEFQHVFVVVPNPCRLLSRELLYTAMTRQRTRLVLLVQGEPLKLLDFRHRSDTARRLTNLFGPPEPVQVGDRTLDGKHVHRSLRGELMVSKSEVLIANALHAARIEYVYERPLAGPDGRARYPDFTIEDADTGEVFYWEHLGMLDDAQYRRRWQQKLTWYASLGITAEGGPGGMLITSDERDGFDSVRIRDIVRKIKKE